MNPHAQALGRRARGKPKTLTPARRRELARALAKVRWRGGRPRKPGTA